MQTVRGNSRHQIGLGRQMEQMESANAAAFKVALMLTMETLVPDFL